VALTLGLVWLTLVIGIRVLLAWRRTGATGIKLRSFGGRPAERAAGGFGAVAIAAVTLAIFGAIAGSPLGGWWWRTAGLGIAVTLVGLVATFVGQLAMGTSWRIGLDRGERTGLVTGGPYRHVRNPIYTAMIVFTIGIALILPGPLTFVAVAALVVALEITVRRVEEPFLFECHGDAYRRWSAHVGRFVPGLGRL
jgi:protein-S-isoprenylcysteine O-methyltransferase Ste14